MASAGAPIGQHVDVAMELLPKSITQPLSRLGAAAQTALEVARFGGLVTDEDPPRTRSRPSIRSTGCATTTPARRGRRASPIVLVPPMMLAADVYDVSPATSAVTLLRERGIDPWVVDFGSPEHERGGLERTLDRPRAGDLGRGRPGPRADRVGRAPGRLLPGWDVLPTRPPPTGAMRARLADLRQLRSTPARGCRSGCRRRSPGAADSWPTAFPRPPAAGMGEPHRLSAARPRQIAAQPDGVHLAAPRPRGAAGA